ncbi:Eukaryotic translation elongation factor 2, partial [Aduncisulcus paluster]
DFSSEVTAALRVTDGSLVVVDCIEGVCVQTETVLRQSLQERVRPVLMLNKLDRVILELQLDPEEAYQTFRRVIENVNLQIQTYSDEGSADRLTVGPEKGTVAFGSGLHGWGFTLTKFATLYAAKFGIPREKLMKRLWGNYFLDKKGKTVKKAGKDTTRYFVHYILNPIYKLFDSIMKDNKKVYKDILEKLGVKLSPDESDLVGKDLLKTVMRKFLPAAEALLEMIIVHLPSPVEAQKYRCEALYTGDMEDECAKAIMACDPKGPLMLYISKMVPTSDKGRFYAFGRVFSGTVKTGQKVRILGPNYVKGKKDDLTIKNIQRTVIMMGGKTEAVESCPCGNTIALVGLDQFILKNATLTTSEEAAIIRSMKFSVSPVVQRSVEPKNPSDLPKLVEGLKRLSKSDPCVQCYTTENGEHIIAGAGELHLEICLKDLQEEYCGAPLVIHDPVVTYRETVTETSSRHIMGKSPNKHNRLLLSASPMDEELVALIDKGDIRPDMDVKERAKTLSAQFGFEPNEARKIWAFGPHMRGPNIFLDATVGVQYMNEIQDHCNRAFAWVTMEGPLGGEQLRGIVFRIHDATLHTDAIHRGCGQIMPACRRALLGSMLVAKPRFMEPMYLVEISCPESACGGVYSVVSRRRGRVFDEEQRVGTPLMTFKAYLPVSESFGFDADLREQTSGQGFPQCSFSHYEIVESDPLEEGNQSYKIMMELRKRKEMKEVIPKVSDYEDRL